MAITCSENSSRQISNIILKFGQDFLEKKRLIALDLNLPQPEH